MTIWAIVVLVFIGFTFVGVGIWIGSEGGKKDVIIGALVGLVATLFISAFVYWYYQNTESGARALKTQESNFNNGIERKVSVYDIQGDLIQEYSGKFDLEYDDDRILFDDENGLRHIIYYPTGTVIIDEIGR